MIEKITQGDRVPFTQVSNDMLCDQHISAKAKGVLCYMLSKPSEWQFNIKSIAGEMKEDKDTIWRILTELIKSNYVHRTDHRDASGRITMWEYQVFQSPHPQNGDMDEKGTLTGSKAEIHPHPQNPDLDNGDILNKDRKIKKKEAEAKDLDMGRSRETKEARPDHATTTSFSKKVEQTLNAQASGTQITAETRQAIDRFGETYGIDALRDVILKYIDEKERDKIRKYVDTDLPERLADATLDLYVPPPKERPEPKEMPVFKYACPQCHHDQSHEVKTNSFGCHACGHSYDKTARDYFLEVAAEAKAS